MAHKLEHFFHLREGESKSSGETDAKTSTEKDDTGATDESTGKEPGRIKPIRMAELIRKHSSGKHGFSCTKCSKLFKSFSDLKAHILTHNSEYYTLLCIMFHYFFCHILWQTSHFTNF